MLGSGAPRHKIQGSRAPLLHSRAPFSQKQHFCSGSKSREALGSGLHNKNFRAPGLQRPPLWDPDKYGEKVDLSMGHRNPKRKMWVNAVFRDN